MAAGYGGAPGPRCLRDGLQHGQAVERAGEQAAAEQGRDAEAPAAVAQLERVVHASAEFDCHPDRRARFRQRDEIAGDGVSVDDETVHPAAAATGISHVDLVADAAKYAPHAE